MAKGKVKVQTDKPSVWDKTIGFIKDKIYDGKWTTPRQYYEDGSNADW